MNKQILVTGSRNWTDPRFIEDALRAEYEPDCSVHHGGAAGADRIAHAVALKLGMHVEEHPAQWSTYGRRAGFLRNKEMVDLKPDVVLAFQINGSKGTQHTIDLAKKAGIPVRGWRVVKIEE